MSVSGLSEETTRLWNELQKFDFSREDCSHLAITTEKITRLKKEKKALILAHSYQTPDILCIADGIGDSYGLSQKAQKTDAEIIIFASVFFMGETAKILNPQKTVLVPQKAGCSLAESITAQQVQEWRKKHPKAACIAYINTSAAVKAEVDVCCTSANALRIIEAVAEEEILFLPDRLMGENLQKMTKKKLHLWNGTCIVHEEFSQQEIKEVRTYFPDAQILAHPECSPNITAEADFLGSTEQMLSFMKKSEKNNFMPMTECGLSDRARQEIPHKHIVGSCHTCPFMKSITLKGILQALQNPLPEQIVNIPLHTLQKAKKSLDRMFFLTEN